ncbi:hypothetical protein [Nakamurella sp.]|uniref:hypothetical protein n=1 Tax=Nakamurella sp. TaxID=1869182 RepID=UPI0037830687
MTQVLPIALIGLGGFLIGGVISLSRKSVPAAVILGVFAAGCIVGGIAWLAS